MTTPAPPSYAGYRFPAEIISHAVWLYFRFPLSLRHVDEILAARGIVVSHETIRQWGLKFGQAFANQIRRRLPRAGDKWHLDEVAVEIAGVKHWLWRAVDQDGMVLDILIQSRRDTQAAKRLLRKLLKRQCRAPRVMITDKLASYGAAKRKIMPGVEHRQHKGLCGRPGCGNGLLFLAAFFFGMGPAWSALVKDPVRCALNVRPVTRPMPLAIMGVRLRVRHQSEQRARSTLLYAVLPELS
jgi:putative transposase